MITCETFLSALDAYRAGTLDDAGSTALEEHAAGCTTCEARLEEATAGQLPPFAPALPETLRAEVLGAIAARRASHRRTIWTRIGAVAAAAAFVAVLLRPAPKGAQVLVADSSAVPAAQLGGSGVSAEDLARSEFRALDDAARELQAALTRTPGDAELTRFLRSIDDQRAALRRQVQDARS